jgi:hypothetical protein
VQEFLRTYEKLLSEGKPPDVVTKYVVDSAQADKDIQTVAQDLGLIPDEKSTVVSATVNDAIAKLHEVQGVIVDTTADGATITVSADTEAAANQFLALNDDVLSKLDGRELVVKVKGDNGEWETIKDTVIAETIPDKTVNILPGKIGPIPLEGGIPVQNANPTNQTAVTQPAAVTVTAEDGVSPVLDKINSDLDTFSTQATSTANATGQAIASGLTPDSRLRPKRQAPPSRRFSVP